MKNIQIGTGHTGYKWLVCHTAFHKNLPQGSLIKTWNGQNKQYLQDIIHGVSFTAQWLITFLPQHLKIKSDTSAGH